MILEWVVANAPDCGDNSCVFGGLGKGGMRTNGGCRCFRDLPDAKRIYVQRLQGALRELAERCRPAAAHDARLRERDAHSDKYAHSYKPVLLAEAARAAKLVDQIDAIIAK